ncbi:alpha-amylase family glycosyl hydrolase [Pseudoroseicyclus tamaricis]|uniref:Alpha-glucosidase n=1 Tax=Pseudoroseicyclus tamaricis TaxID=2705421 RepID=A0A6B2JWF2_9RHOB|nr:alpha-amylase family glycosyl hydrolase [Pseudoroseicyclus tamaricis]NDV02450.1 alpha-glucosidase [Pseudoroseicyclus tamaricis]
MREWWRDAVIYQIYPRSYQDSDGDGIGDLPGITSRLEHVASLGVDAIWLSPFFTSPDADMGYDVSDYTGVSPLYGTMEDFDAMLDRAHELGLKVIIDQVLSHSSIEHPWFEESRSSRDNPKADWYVWADPQRDGSPPNNWLSIFGGSAWEFDPRRKQYYLHNFLKEQPDLNFHNPETVDALLETMEFWLKKGVDGFRLDTVNFYVHDAQLRSNPPSDWTKFPVNPYEAQDQLYSKTQPENIAILQRLRALTDKYDARMMVGEVGEMGRQIDIMAEYTTGDDRLHMAYSFEFLSSDQTAEHFSSRISRFFAKAPEGWPCWSFSNHDVSRHVSRWTQEGEPTEPVAKQAIALLTSFPGTLGIYQGEELGQTDTEILFEELQDTANIEFWPEYKGRDGCRSPMVWSAQAEHGGFSDAKPWLPVKPEQAARAVDRQEGDEGSVLAAYREALAFRKERDELRLGEADFIDLPEPVLGLRRVWGNAHLTALFNLSAEPQALSLIGAGTPVGPGLFERDGASLDLPPRGFVFLESQGALTVTLREVEAAT